MSRDIPPLKALRHGPPTQSDYVILACITSFPDAWERDVNAVHGKRHVF